MSREASVAELLSLYNNLWMNEAVAGTPIPASKLPWTPVERLIAAGSIRPGRPITEMEVGKALGISRMSARVAVECSVATGLLSKEANRSAVLLPVSSGDVLDIFALRALVEWRAISEALASGSDLSTAHRAAQQYEETIAGQQQSAIMKDLEFHQALVDSAGNRRLSAIFRLLRTATLAATMQSGIILNSERACAQHRRILELTGWGTGENAQDALVEHLDELSARIRSALPFVISR